MLYSFKTGTYYEPIRRVKKERMNVDTHDYLN